MACQPGLHDDHLQILKITQEEGNKSNVKKLNKHEVVVQICEVVTRNYLIVTIALLVFIGSDMYMYD